MKKLSINKTLEIPALGLGTYQLLKETAVQLTMDALELGYRHIDTAPIYNNEEFIGKAIELSKIPRQEIFITTKVWPDCFKPYLLIQSIELSLKKLRTSYVDLLLLHWPPKNEPISEVVIALNQAHKKGYAKNIGVSNFTIAQMEEAVQHSDAPIVFNQIEYHPYLTQKKLIQAAKKLNINIMAHSSLAKGNMRTDKTILKIGKKYNKDACQVVFRWLTQLGIAALTRSTSKAHLAANFEIFDFQLTEEDMHLIDLLGEPPKRFIHVDSVAPKWD